MYREPNLRLGSNDDTCLVFFASYGKNALPIYIFFFFFNPNSIFLFFPFLPRQIFSLEQAAAEMNDQINIFQTNCNHLEEEVCIKMISGPKFS